MPVRLFTISLAVAIPALSPRGADGSLEAFREAPAAADTILRTDLDRPAGSVRVGLTAGEQEPHARLGLRRIRVAGGEIGIARPPSSFVVGTVGIRDSIALEPLSDAMLRWRVAALGPGGAGGPGFLARSEPSRPPARDQEPGRFG